MNWPVLLSMILIFVIGLTTFRSSGPTNGIIITLVLLMIFYIAYGQYYNSSEGFFADDQLTPQQQIMSMILYRLTVQEKPGINDELDKLLKDLNEKKINGKQLADKVYLLFKSHENIIKSYEMTFDDFFLKYLELMITSQPQPLSDDDKKIADELKLYVKEFTKNKTTASASASASGADKAPASAGVVAPASGSPDKAAKPTTLPDIEKLIQVIKPAPAQTVQPSASASEIGTVIPTSPGLQQGTGFSEVAAKRCPPPAPRRCPQPAAQPNCACQQPIMPDGKPFDPNMYIRKDSIPCWNCQLPI